MSPRIDPKKNHSVTWIVKHFGLLQQNPLSSLVTAQG